jgi:hypothetical protein
VESTYNSFWLICLRKRDTGYIWPM